jgi:hypothetical protein
MCLQAQFTIVVLALRRLVSGFVCLANKVTHTSMAAGGGGCKVTSCETLRHRMHGILLRPDKAAVQGYRGDSNFIFDLDFLQMFFFYKLVYF